MEDVKIINGQAAELAEGRAEVFQLRQELQLLRHGVAQKSPCSYSVKNTVKFNVSRKSYWDVDRVTRSTSEILQRIYHQNLNQSSYVSLRNFPG